MGRNAVRELASDTWAEMLVGYMVIFVLLGLLWANLGLFSSPGLFFVVLAIVLALPRFIGRYLVEKFGH